MNTSHPAVDIGDAKLKKALSDPRDVEDMPPLEKPTADRSWHVGLPGQPSIDASAPAAFKFTAFDAIFRHNPKETLEEQEERCEAEYKSWLSLRAANDALHKAAQAASHPELTDEEYEAERKKHLESLPERSGPRPSSEGQREAQIRASSQNFDPTDVSDPRHYLHQAVASLAIPVAAPAQTPTIVDQIDSADRDLANGEDERTDDEPQEDLLNVTDESAIEIADEDCIGDGESRSTGREYRIYKHLLKYGFNGAILLYDMSLQLRRRIKDKPDEQRYTYDSASEVSRRTGLTVKMVESLRRKLSVEGGPLVAKKLRSRQLQYGLRDQVKFIDLLDDADADTYRKVVTCLRYDAELLGIPAAIIYANRGYHHRKNAKEAYRLHEGRYWHYFSIAGSVTPGGAYEGFLSHDQVWRGMKRLVDQKKVLTLPFYSGRGFGPGVFKQDRLWLTLDVEPVTDQVVANNHVRWNGFTLPSGIVLKVKDKAATIAQPTHAEGSKEIVARKVGTEKAIGSAISPVGSAECPVSSAKSPVRSAERPVTFPEQPTQTEGTAEAGPRPLEALDMKPLTAPLAALPPQEKKLEKKPTAMPGDAGRAAPSTAAPSPTSPAVAVTCGAFASHVIPEGKGGCAAEGTEETKMVHQNKPKETASVASNITNHQDSQRAAGAQAKESRNTQRPGSRARVMAALPQEELTSDGAAGVTVPVTEDVQKILLEIGGWDIQEEEEPQLTKNTRPSARGLVTIPAKRVAAAPVALPPKVSNGAAGVFRPRWREPETKRLQEIVHDQPWSTSTYVLAYTEVFGEAPDHAFGDPKTLCENAHALKLPARVYMIVSMYAWLLSHPGQKLWWKHIVGETAFNAVENYLEAARRKSTPDELGLAIVLGKVKCGKPDWLYVPGPRDKYIADVTKAAQDRFGCDYQLSREDYTSLLHLAGDRSGEQTLRRLTMRVRVTLRASKKKSVVEAIQPLLESEDE